MLQIFSCFCFRFLERAGGSLCGLRLSRLVLIVLTGIGGRELHFQCIIKRQCGLRDSLGCTVVPILSVQPIIFLSFSVGLHSAIRCMVPQGSVLGPRH